MHAIWLTWERQRRNRSMASGVGAQLHELEHNGSALARYSVLIYKTTQLVLKNKPDVIFFQNPSIVLGALIATLKFLSVTKAKVIGDFHNAGIFPARFKFLVRWIVRNSDLIIVSNMNLKPAVISQGGVCIAIPDPIPKIDNYHDSNVATDNRFNILFICSWAPDEPVGNVLQAALILEATCPDASIYITGRPKIERTGWIGPLPSNVHLTGYLSEKEFETRLLNSSVILDLTTRSDCMVCGAYEAVGAETPMIVSNNEPTRLYFRKGALYTDNSAEDIAKSIVEAKSKYSQLKDEIVELKEDLIESEQQALHNLSKIISLHHP